MLFVSHHRRVPAHSANVLYNILPAYHHCYVHNQCFKGIYLWSTFYRPYLIRSKGSAKLWKSGQTDNSLVGLNLEKKSSDKR